MMIASWTQKKGLREEEEEDQYDGEEEYASGFDLAHIFDSVFLLNSDGCEIVNHVIYKED